jgi:nitroreductase
MELRDGIRTTGAVRGFTDQVVDDLVVHDILDDARFVPSGGNRQPWRVAIIKDVTLRHHLGEAMKPVWDEYVAISATGQTPFTVVDASPYQLASVAPGNVPNDLLDNIGKVPVVLAIAADLGSIAMMDKDLERATITGGASIYPFCWSVVLSARSRGLGGVITTFASRVETTTGPLLGLPQHWALAATIFLGYPIKQTTKLKRHPVESFTTLNTFDGEQFTI